MLTLGQFFAIAAGNAALVYYRRTEAAPLDKMTDGELRCVIFLATLSVALGGGLDRPRLQLTYAGGN